MPKEWCQYYPMSTLITLMLMVRFLCYSLSRGTLQICVYPSSFKTGFMISKSLQKTLLIYLAFAFFFTCILTIVCLVAEYLPLTAHFSQKFGLGALVLNSVLWSFLFTFMGSSSLLNQYESVRKHFLESLAAFILLPLIAALMVWILVPWAGDMFGFKEAAIIFSIVKLYFFSRFRSCARRLHDIAID